MKYVLTYSGVPDFRPLAAEHFPAHQQFCAGFAQRGVLLAIGVLFEPPNGDALAVFTSREAAEEFVAGDPFVLHGVVASHTIRPWQENLLPVPDAAG
jgi:uncharacterized protein YciI